MTDTAVKLFTMAAEKGYAKAQNQIGKMWAAGVEGKPDLKEAVIWYRKAGVQGLAEAQFNLGLCYARGEGVAADRIEAWRWLQLGANQEYPKAAEEREKVQKLMTAKEQEEARARVDHFRSLSTTNTAGAKN